MQILNKVAVASFWTEVEKIASSDEDSRRRRRWLKGTAGIIAGTGLGYGLGSLLGKKYGDKISPRAAGAAGALAGVVAPTLFYLMRAYANEPPPKPDRELRDLGAVQPQDGKLSERRKGHTPPVSPGRVPSDATGGGEVPLRAGRGPGVDRREGIRADHFRSGSDQYRFGGKAPRNYSFTRPGGVG